MSLAFEQKKKKRKVAGAVLAVEFALSMCVSVLL